ncbi:MAG: GNAT family N-acetyltransferase [Dehalococcoidia bacterium]|nr:GNAT family N-acetyltransferase [Dehalococcoidia bacterium]
MQASSPERFTFKAVKSAEWYDLERVFLSVPGSSMCWCMYWRKTRAQWWDNGSENRADMKEIVEGGVSPGIVAYDGDEPVAWCSIAPRSEFPGLERSPTLRAVDAEPTWSITCFTIARSHRKKGLTSLLIRAAIEHAVENGAKVIEAYPMKNLPQKRRTVGEAFMGFSTTFEHLGFRQVSERSRVRNIWRFCLPPNANESPDTV